MSDITLDWAQAHTWLPEHFVIAQDIPTRWNDNDMYGHVNNARYYTFFELVTMHYLEIQCQIDFNALNTQTYSVESRCRYINALAYPDLIDARMRVAHIGNSSVRYQLGLYVKGESSIRAAGEVSEVFVNAETGRPAPMPAPIRAALSAASVTSI